MEMSTGSLDSMQSAAELIIKQAILAAITGDHGRRQSGKAVLVSVPDGGQVSFDNARQPSVLVMHEALAQLRTPAPLLEIAKSIVGLLERPECSLGRLE